VGNSEVIARILDNLRGRLDDLRRRVGYLEANAEGPSDLEMWERLTTYHRGGAAAITAHFGGAALSSSWAWAGAPCVTPAARLARAILYCSFSAANRGFLYQPFVAGASRFRASVSLRSWSAGDAVGLRLDDGSDNNYAEVVLYLSAAGPSTWHVQARYRAGGGAVASVTGPAIYIPNLYVITLYASGTRWTAWGIQANLEGAHAGWMLPLESDPAAGAASWTPTRAGIIFVHASALASSEMGYVDWCDLNV